MSPLLAGRAAFLLSSGAVLSTRWMRLLFPCVFVVKRVQYTQYGYIVLIRGTITRSTRGPRWPVLRVQPDYSSRSLQAQAVWPGHRP